ncbi:MAG: NAD(P)H-hydrate dehydratase [Acidimicrobiia bacterium]|nr:NAD(P)H-hydrate dehydratase [Acidimicrobiia bacterium]
MKPVITPSEAARLDRVAPEPVEVLMERAGWAVENAAARMGAGYGSRVAVLAGPGNNGGDGYVAAGLLRRRGAAVVVHQLSEPKTDAARWALERASAAGVEMEPLGAPPPRVDLVVDAVFGGGFRGRCPPALTAWMEHPAPVLSVDFPSGMDPGTGQVPDRCFQADRTVTFHALKTGHLLGQGPDYCGEVEVADIGQTGETPAMFLAEAGDCPRPARRRTVHKWRAGSVVVMGGSRGMTGAPLLAARSALRAGAGSVGLMVPGGCQEVVAGAAPELLTYGLGSEERFVTARTDACLETASRFDVMVIGPGIGADGQTVRWARRMIEEWEGPLVVDADALGASDPALLSARREPTVITPHRGELASLTGDAPRLEEIRDLAASGLVVLAKGNPTLVCDPRETWVVREGGPELATIGTGDVLAGWVAAFWARGLSPAAAARSAAFWHGRAGAALAARRTVTADALSDEVGRWAWETSR